MLIRPTASVVRRVRRTLRPLIALAGLGLTSCTFTFDPVADGTPLDQLQGWFVFSTMGADTEVTATFRTARGQLVTIADDQSVLIDGQALSGPFGANEYSATIPSGSEFVVQVVEPTRGTEATTVGGPELFDITAPAESGDASLSGFTLNWSAANPNLQVEIELAQTLFGSEIRATFGPHPDAGSFTFDAAALQPFRQGAPLVIRVRKFIERANIAGFASSNVRLAASATRLATPTP